MNDFLSLVNAALSGNLVALGILWILALPILGIIALFQRK